MMEMEEYYDSPLPRPATSGRKGSKKVRSGCITCKIRKVKCDEQKPFCNRCSRTGRKCDGYLDAKSMTQRRKRQHVVPQPSSAFSLARLSEGASLEEKRSFSFFQHVTAPALSGDFDGNFWSQLVLQICQTQPAVRHAVLSVSSFHEVITGGAIVPLVEGDDRQSFALNQYNMAITCLLKEMEHVDEQPLVPLLTCIMFVFVEFMQRKDTESLNHLEQGRKILRRLERKDAKHVSNIDIVKRFLVPMYTRLSITSFMFGGGIPVVIPTSLKTLPELPTALDSIDHVRYALYDFMDESLRFTSKSRPMKFSKVVSPEKLRALENEQDYLLRKLAKFNVAISLFQAKSPRNTPAGSLDLMLVHMHTTYVWLSTALAKHQTVYDDYLSTFSSIIALTGSFLAATEPPDANRGTKSSHSAAPGSTQRPISGETPEIRGTNSSTPRNFSFETQVIAPLYFTAVKCRHPLIRRTALRMLGRNPSRRENLWSARIYAAIARATIKLEEKYIVSEIAQAHSQSLSTCSSSSSSACSVSPPPPPFTAPATYGASPERVWASRLPDLPLPHDYRADVMHAEQQQQQKHRSTPWFDNVTDASTFSGEVDSGISAPETYALRGAAAVPLEGMNLALGSPPIDPGLLSFDAGSEDVASVHSSYSAASSFDGMQMTASAPTVARMAVPVPIPAQLSHGHTRSYSHSPQAAGAWPSPALAPTTMVRSISSISGGLDVALTLAPTSGALYNMSTPPQGRQQRQKLHNQSHNHQHRQLHNTYHGRNRSQNGKTLEEHGPLQHGHQYAQSKPKTRRSTEPPYDLPEEVRVHEAMIGPEKEDGGWIQIFRKLNGLEGDWDVQTEFVPVTG